MSEFEYKFVNESIPQELRRQVIEVTQLVRDKQQTLSFAESCTGGLLSSLVTELSGVSDIFLGSVVSYANEVKENVLGVRGSDLKTSGAVSDTVARQMVLGALRNLKSSLAISITGVAGPNGGSKEKPVGTVFIAVGGAKHEARNQDEVEVYHHLFSGNRRQIQIQSCAKALEHLNNFLNKHY